MHKVTAATSVPVSARYRAIFMLSSYLKLHNLSRLFYRDNMENMRHDRPWREAKSSDGKYPSSFVHTHVSATLKHAVP